MKKRILALLLCALLVLGGLPTMAKQPESSDVSQRFFDVKKTDWFYKNGALQFVCDNQWFAGTSDTTFGPNEPMTRAMFVTVLGRMAGISVDHSFSIAFRDVPKNTYYTGYVRWANSNGIVYGVENDCFAPGDYITREQICVMLMRYCKYADLYLQTAAKPVVFADAKNISGYAREGVAWCQRAGVINGEKVGTGYLFRPQGLATRAEVATMMMNFWQNRWKGSNTDTVCMSFNVLEWDTRYTGYATPQTRAPWIVDTIRRYNPDLLGMQEVTKGSATTLNFDMCSYLTDELKDQYAYRTLMDEKGKSGSTVVVNKLTIASGLIVFWKKDRFELKDSGAMVYSNDGVRHFQWVKLYDRQEDVTVIMTNTHFSINPSSDVTAGAGLRLT
ncbi:MAG: S-layer homology domain-containing protein, partial [Clostridia bacterium]|nr:S-layer homology domain-containing protein [Clostridia bacterium]